MPMFYSQAENKYVNDGTAFELGGVQYPANWLNLSTLAAKTAIGLVEVQVVGAPGDDRYYWVSETLNGATLTYTNTPKDLDGLKKSSADQVNATAYSLLLPSDWMVVRAAEGGAAMPDDWKQYRAAVRATANTARDQIDMAFDIDSLIAACQIDWPHDPDYVAPAEPTPV